MQTITLNNQSLITITDAASALGVKRQSLHKLCKRWHISLIPISGNTSAISVVDFENIRDNRQLDKRPKAFR